MIVIKKKNVLQELAVSLYLMLEFNPDTTALTLIQRIRDRAADALQTATFYTGTIGKKEIEAFLKSKPLKFSIDCGKDIVKGDVIRFVETIFDNRFKPPRRLGQRGVIAEVLDVRTKSNNPILHMRVISSGGAWEIKPDEMIRRTMRNVIHTEVMRAAWDNEAKRAELKTIKETLPELTKTASARMLERYADLRRK